MHLKGTLFSWFDTIFGFKDPTSIYSRWFEMIRKQTYRDQVFFLNKNKFLDGWYVCSYMIIPSCMMIDWFHIHIWSNIWHLGFLFFVCFVLKSKTILCMSTLKKGLWKNCINMHKHDAFANRLPLYPYKLPWVKIKSQELIYLFIHPYGNHSNNTIIISCYCVNSCFETTRDVAKLARNDVIAHINVGI